MAENEKRESQVHSWVKGAVWVMGIGLPLLVGGVGLLWRIDHDAIEYRASAASSKIIELDAIVQGLLITTAECKQRQETHESESGYWKRKIDINSDKIAECQKVSSSILSLKEALDELRKDVRETEGYYRKQVLPLIQQSNSLQLQSLNNGK